MKTEQVDLAYDEEKIASISKRMIDEAIRPYMLADYVSNYLNNEAREELDALRTAINSDYPEFRERFDRGETGDVETELRIIDEQVNFHIGVAVGLRLR